MSALKLFQLEEGRVYNAITKNTTVGRKFQIINGQLLNNSGGSRGFTTICTYLPSDAEFVVSEDQTGAQGSRKKLAKFEPEIGNRYTVAQFQEGFIYEMYPQNIARVGNELMAVKDGHPVSLYKAVSASIGLDSYKCIGELKSKTLPPVAPPATTEATKPAVASPAPATSVELRMTTLENQVIQARKEQTLLENRVAALEEAAAKPRARKVTSTKRKRSA